MGWRMEIVSQELWDKKFCLYPPPYAAMAGMEKAKSLGKKCSLVLRDGNVFEQNHDESGKSAEDVVFQKEVVH